MISIIIPAYNCEAYIGICLDSILAQSHSDLEIICVEDGSHDGTRAILKQYADRDKRVVLVLRDQNMGISASRNEALRIAKGEWVMFVDSDDWIAPDNCRLALETAERQQADTVVWCYTREFESQSLPKVFETKERVWNQQSVGLLQRRMFGPYGEELAHPELLDAWGTIWGKLYSRRVICSDNAITFVDTNVVGTAEDVVFNIDYMGKAQKVVYVPQPWYHYRKNMTSYSNIHRGDLVRKWDKLYDEMERRIGEGHLGKDFEMALQNRIALGVLGLSIIALRSNGSWREKYRAVKEVLGRDRQHQALSQLQLHYFAPHWKVYYFAAKHKLTPLFMAIQMAINKIIEKNNK